MQAHWSVQNSYTNISLAFCETTSTLSYRPAREGLGRQTNPGANENNASIYINILLIKIADQPLSYVGDYQSRYDPSKHIESGTGGALAEAFSRLLKNIWNEDQSTQYIVAQELEVSCMIVLHAVTCTITIVDYSLCSASK